MPKPTTHPNRQIFVSKTPDFYSALSCFSSFSQDLNLLLSVFNSSHTSLDPSFSRNQPPQRRAKPTARSSAWKEKHRTATKAAAVTAAAVTTPTIPSGRREVLRQLIVGTAGDCLVSESSESASDGSDHSFEVNSDLLEEGSDYDPDYLPSDDTLDGSSSGNPSDHRSIAFTSDLSTGGNYDSDNPYGSSPDHASDATSEEYSESDDDSDCDDEAGSVAFWSGDNHSSIHPYYSPPDNNRDGSAYKQPSDSFKQWSDFVSKTFQSDQSDDSHTQYLDNAESHSSAAQDDNHTSDYTQPPDRPRSFDEDRSRASSHFDYDLPPHFHIDRSQASSHFDYDLPPHFHICEPGQADITSVHCSNFQNARSNQSDQSLDGQSGHLCHNDVCEEVLVDTDGSSFNEEEEALDDDDGYHESEDNYE